MEAGLVEPQKPATSGLIASQHQYLTYLHTTPDERNPMIGGDAIRGYIDLMVLSILREHASYPYELVKTITEISGGAYAIKQTTLYSAVKRLEATGLVASFPDVSESGKPRTYYRLTDEGRASLRSKIAEWKATRAVVDRFVKGSH